jgi:hypothetical protein
MTTYIKARKGLFYKENEDGIVVLSKNEKEIFMLNKTASLIWKLCFTGSRVSMEDIISGIQKEFIIGKDSVDRCKKDCMLIIKKNPELFEIIS